MSIVVALKYFSSQAAEFDGSQSSSDHQAELQVYLRRYFAFLSERRRNIILLNPLIVSDIANIDCDLVEDVNKDDWLTEPTCHSVSVEDINRYLHAKWNMCSARTGGVADKLTLCISEIESEWLPAFIGEQFLIKFDAPDIKVLCPQEVLIFFHVKQIFWPRS